MRRPLFGTGFPQSAPVVALPETNPEDCLQVMDLRSLSAEQQSYTRFITLFAGLLTDDTLVGVYVQVGSDTPTVVAQLNVVSEEDTALPNSCTFAIRGNCRVFAASGLGATVIAGAVYGFYELETDQPVLEVPRPLQPSDPISPFTVVPTLIPQAGSTVVHAFDEDYIDLVTIRYAYAPSEGGSISTVDFPNGVSILLPPDNNVALSQRTLMQGIPMLSDADNQTIEVTTDDSILVITGSFTRNG